jgi:hypothetical protein
LSQEEKAALAALPKTAPQTLLVVAPGGEVSKVETTAGEAVARAATLASESPLSTIVPDFPVELRVDAEVTSRNTASQPDLPKLRVDKQFLLSGKEEFGLKAWREAYPEADGRGVKIGVVDDGVALGRLGLLLTSTGRAKFAASVNVSPQWHVPLRSQRPGCARTDMIADTATASWRFAPGVLPSAPAVASLRVPFDITPCGVNPELPGQSRGCTDWDGLFPNADARKVDGVLRVPALLVEYAAGSSDAAADAPSRTLLVDVDGDGLITQAERVRELPRRDESQAGIKLANGSVLGFDVHASSSLAVAPNPIDNPTSCVGADVAPAAHTLTLHVPQTGEDFGSHGEGVASIAAGHDIAGQGFDGVAPGAQIVDVHFADSVGGRDYTIAEVGRALRAAGERSDIVNLSYSLFFRSPAAQAAMGRYLEALLVDTRALYLFSAGNNGPGRGSMNRAGVYPSFGMPVGAYLTPEQAQSTFGSALPIGGVVTYSSRGPGLDGGAGPLVISPLAGIVAGTADEGFGPFSGTSSATPALAGFAARVLSQVRAEGLPWDRDALHRAIVASAVALDDVAFVDQGHGLPRLLPALEAYRKAVAETKPAPSYVISGGVGALGIARKGVSVRGDVDRLDVYSFTLTPSFPSSWSDADAANWAETLTVDVETPKGSEGLVSVPSTIFSSRSGTTLQIAPQWDALAQRPGEFLATVRLRDADSGALRATIPVTILTPHTTKQAWEGVVSIPSKDLARVFLRKPSWATHLVVAREAVSARQPLCGRFGAYSPVGVRLASPAGGTWGSAAGVRAEAIFEATTEGIYELDMEGRANHTACPRDARQKISARWVQLSLTGQSLAVGATDAQGNAQHVLRLSAESRVSPGLAGVVELSQPAEESTIELRLSPESPFRWEGPALDLSPYLRGSFAFDAGDVARIAAARGYPRSSLALRPVADNNPWPAFTSLPTGTEWSAPITVASLGLDELAAQGVVPTVTTFDVGLDASVAPLGTLRLKIRGFTADEARVALTLPLSAVRPSNPATLEGTFSAKPGALSGRSLACAFRPAGFSVSVPCGSIPLR